MCIRPDELIQKTSAMEAAELSLKSQVELSTDAIRASKIKDCSYNRNCGALFAFKTLSFIRIALSLLSEFLTNHFLMLTTIARLAARLA